MSSSVRRRVMCNGCGHVGEEIVTSDDWGRSSTGWVGFERKPTSAYEAHRMRSDGSPVCVCGSRSVTRGEVISD